ncbi:MAG: hypothetical protein KC435_12580 [Thermomicrobiales bacterium]|nr:hypothetical protein [Thermomicrobiales bacterium]
MANDVFAGPVNYVVFGFPESASVGEGLTAVLERVDTGIVEILDIEYVTTTSSGELLAGAITDLQDADGYDLSVFEGACSGLLDGDDLATILDSLEPGWFAIAVIYEDRSLACAGSAWAQAGGKELLIGGIDIEELASTLE